MLRPSSHAPGRILGKAEKENPEEHTSCLEITDKLSCSGELNLFVWFCKKELWPACWSYDCNTIETDFETRRRLSEYSEFAEDALALKLLLKVWSMEPQCGLHGKRIRKALGLRASAYPLNQNRQLRKMQLKCTLQLEGPWCRLPTWEDNVP